MAMFLFSEPLLRTDSLVLDAVGSSPVRLADDMSMLVESLIANGSAVPAVGCAFFDLLEPNIQTAGQMAGLQVAMTFH